MARGVWRRAAGAVAAMLALGVVMALRDELGEPVEAAVGSQFNPGFIVTDQNFFDKDAMSAAQIQAFIASKEPTCAAGYTCLKDYRVDTPSEPANLRCAAYPGAPAELASTIIYKVAQTCGISPKTILVTLQKEQGLVTSPHPSQAAYRAAMGADCPDTPTGCQSNFGFFLQVREGARSYKAYADVSSYPVGQTSAILYSPTYTACKDGNGTPLRKDVFVQNEATHALYVYTPYTPDPNVLQQQYLYTGVPNDPCASYGNRNFWVYWSDWFGSPTNNNAPYGEVTAETTTQAALTVSGWGVDPDTSAPIPVKIYVDGTVVATVTANGTDPATQQKYTYYGPSHAFTAVVPNVAPGIHQVCAQGQNIAGPGSANTFDCRYIGVPGCGVSVTCPAVDRVQAADRFAQSIQISQQAFPSHAPVVFITTGLNFPDALSAAPAAAQAGGPLLLTDGSTVSSDLAAEIRRLAPSRIVVVGGPAAVSDRVVSSLTQIVPNTVRIGGADRFEVSRNVATTFFPHATSGYVVTGLNFPDALSADSVASAQKRPVILVNPSQAVDAPTSALITGSGMTALTIVGGTAVVPTAYETALARLVSVTRLAGADRFDTSHLANTAVYPAPAHVYVATGLNFPDALAGAVLAAKNGAPLYLTQTGCMSRPLFSDVFAAHTTRVSLLGGTSALGPDVARFVPCSG